MIGSLSGHPHSSVRYVGGRNRLSPLASSSRYRSATYRSTGDPSSLRPSSLTRWASSGFRSAGAVSNPAIRLASIVARGDRPRHDVAARLRRLRPRYRRTAATQRPLLHPIEPQAVVEQHLALGGIGDVLSPEQGGDRPGVRVSVVARLADEQRVEVQGG